MTMLNESLRKHDLDGLVSKKIHIDEFKSKMGDDSDIIVVSFKVTGREPSEDLVDFIEKAYSFVLDADVSSGELDDGEYLVFVEIERSASAVANIMKMLKELDNLVNVEVENYAFSYAKEGKYTPCDFNNLSLRIPLTPKAYKEKYGDQEIEELKAAAGVKTHKKAPKNDYTESLRVAAGIK
jgi:galactitol-specific phosphotransferase system IIB component